MIELTGAWRLVSYSRNAPNGDVLGHPFGEHPHGALLYTSDGQVSVHLSSADREHLSSPDPRRFEEAEAARAFRTYVGYSGRYEAHGDTVVHTVEMCSIPNLIGVDQVRHVGTDGDMLVLRTPAIDTPDGPVVLELRWVRAA